MNDDPKDWRKLPLAARPFNAYKRARFIEPGCDHAGPYCKCDPPYHLRGPTAEEEAIEARRSDVLAKMQEGK